MPMEQQQQPPAQHDFAGGVAGVGGVFSGMQMGQASASTSASVPRQHKPRGSVSDQQRRRDIALARQKAARRDLQAHARRLVQECTATAAPSGKEASWNPRGSFWSGGAGDAAAPSQGPPPGRLGSSSGSLSSGQSGSTVREGFHSVHVIEGDSDVESSSGAARTGGATWPDHGVPGGDDTSRPRPKIAELDEATGAWCLIDKDGRRTFQEGGAVPSQRVTSSSDSDSAMDVLRPDDCPDPMQNGNGSSSDHMHNDSGNSNCQMGGVGPMATENVQEASRGLPAPGGECGPQWYAQQLMTPEWMLDIPPNLQSEWYVVPRPEGRRCLVIASNGTTVSRLRNGRVLHRFPSLLPNGARTANVAAAAHVYCILDCVFHEPDSTYYILDVMAWRGHTLYDCTTEFRFFWLRSKLPEIPGQLGIPSHYHRFRFCPLPVHECTRQGLQEAYAGPVPFQRDGLLFYNRHAHYSLGLTPLALQWKDERCSTYVVDTDADGKVPTHQQVMLEYRSDGTVATGDSPPVVFGKLPAAFCASNAKHLKSGMLLKFAVGDAGIELAGDGSVVAADLRYVGPANQRRAGADSFSKIMFQYSVRHNPLTFSQVVETIGRPSEDTIASSSTDDMADIERDLS